jgi:hypothetical protein
MTAPRLAAIDPADVAAEVVDAVLVHVARLAMPLSPTCRVDVRSATAEERANSGLGLSVQDLARYAQTGDPGDWGGDDGALGVMQEIAEAYFTSASQQWRVDALTDEAGAPTDAIGVVMVAAETRRRLAAGSPIPRRWLEVLLGVGERYVRKLVEAGTLECGKGKPPLPRYLLAPSVLRYLAARVVGDADAGAVADHAAVLRWRTGPTGESLLVRGGGAGVAMLATQRGWERAPGRAPAWVATRAEG